MRCYSCGKISWSFICRDCCDILKEPTVGIRQLNDEFKVYYFYNYSDIKKLILSKNHLCGSFILSKLCSLSIAEFKNVFNPNIQVDIFPIDDRIKNSFSHTAIIARHLKSKNLKPIYCALHSNSNIDYTGKDLQFRLKHPRKFKLLKYSKNPVILVDDIITTGSTMLEAFNFLKSKGVEVLFGIVLADARY